ncbi:MAG: beta-CASP ribonuclease aCPSF1 [Nanoarchaeota archaeon]|nr:beta-CASP ribonuclease aCPSF1 [Nanoarchaeota archaeon]MBU4451792.1 beta-CASP ribonuclease aCPSF1 [Nanoarchaeota archaeon]
MRWFKMELKELIERLPKAAMITSAGFEGAEVVLYTKSKKFFVESSDEIKALVSEIHKRIDVRPDPEICTEQESAKSKIKELVPKEAAVEKIEFEPEFGKVIIYAQKPGVVIGKAGETLRAIKEQTVWSPEIQRVPLFVSNIVNKAREIVHEEAKYRRKFLTKIGEKIQLKKGAKEGWVRLSFLGGFREVGRSCLFLQTKESRVLLDCGEGMSNIDAHPSIDVPEFDLGRLDAIIVSHAHLDHSGFVPYLYEYGYEGPVYSTLPTRDLMTMLQLDYIDIAQREHGRSPYSSKGIKNAIKHSITLDYNEVCDITPDMRLTFQNAGHILGSAITHLHIGEGFYNLVYSGDIKFGRTHLFEPAFTNFSRVEGLVIESTYGAQGDIVPQLQVGEQKIIDIIKRVSAEKGKVIIPSFSVGRSQEIMVILAECARKGILDVPVYLDGMVWDATAIHTTYPEFLSRELQKQIFHNDINPFVGEHFKKVTGSNERKAVIESPESGVIITTSGMMTGGPVMEYVRELGDSKKNTLVFVGYQAEGTLGSKIQRGFRDIPIPGSDGSMKSMRLEMDIQTVEGFSGHSDRNQLMNFVSHLRARPEKIIVNHGEVSKSLNLASAIHKTFRIDTEVPGNMDAMRLR